jgi:hypothetical protein
MGGRRFRVAVVALLCSVAGCADDVLYGGGSGSAGVAGLVGESLGEFDSDRPPTAVTIGVDRPEASPQTMPRAIAILMEPPIPGTTARSSPVRIESTARIRSRARVPAGCSLPGVSVCSTHRRRV